MAKKKKTDELINIDSGGWPKVNQGSHLTVLTYEDGRTELKWDDEALMRDVLEAIASAELTVEVKPKKTRKAKA